MPEGKKKVKQLRYNMKLRQGKVHAEEAQL